MALAAVEVVTRGARGALAGQLAGAGADAGESAQGPPVISLPY